MSIAPRISQVLRAALIEHPEGLTARQLSKLTGYTQDKVIPCLMRTYGCYISKYIPNPSGALNLSALWCCVAVPANAKKPQAEAVIIDEIKALEEKRRLSAQEKKRKERILQKRANEKIRAAAKAEKERLKQLKAAAPEYVPERTTWVKVPSWPEQRVH